jgi:hypothetical protein
MRRDCRYRDQDDLMFHHTNVKSNGRSRRPGSKNSKNLHSTPAFRSSQTSPRVRKQSQFLLGRIGRELLPSKEDLPLCFFYQKTLESLIDTDRAQYLHLQLPALFSRSETGSVLNLATQAIALAIWARSRPDDLNAGYLSRMRYLQSLSAMNAAVRDPMKAKSDDTLYAVLMLSGYEVRLLQLSS